MNGNSGRFLIPGQSRVYPPLKRGDNSGTVPGSVPGISDATEHVLTEIAKNSVREKFMPKWTIDVLSITWWKGKLRFNLFKNLKESNRQ